MEVLEQLLCEARDEFAAGNLDQARLVCLAGLSEFPYTPQLLTVLGWIYAQRGDRPSAEAAFRHALCGDAASFDAHSGLAAVLAADGRHQEAESSFARAISIFADDSDTLFGYGCALIALRRYEQAAEVLEQTLRLEPNRVGAIHNLAIAHAQLGRWQQAAEYCDQALAADSQATQSQLLRGMSRIAMGSFAEGWDDYDARCRLQDDYSRQLGLPAWNGIAKVHSIVVVPEQGIGTQVMLASCLADLLAVVPSVTVGCELRLIGPLQRSFPTVTFVADGLLPALVAAGNYDAYVMAGSLPRVFRRTLAAFPARTYLQAEPARRRRWRERLTELGSGLKVGVAWGGGAGKADTVHRRTVPQDWWPLVTVPNVDWINLQFDVPRAEFAEWRQLAGGRFHDWSDLDRKHDLENFAALVSELDLVISVVNSTVHVAGALGVPTWTLVPAGGEWRWLASGEKCVWHDSVRLFRQRQLDDWSGVFRSLRSELASLSRTSSRRRRKHAA
ncbi:MAG: tetratricopeptide repeat protein [Pirellulales bacterium]